MNNTKKDNLFVIGTSLVVLILIWVVALTGSNHRELAIRQGIQNQPQTQDQKDLNSAVSNDSTQSINNSINSINVDDTSTTDLNSVDKELQNL